MLISIAYDAAIPHAPLMNHVAMQLNAIICLMNAAVLFVVAKEARPLVRFVLLAIAVLCCTSGLAYLYSL